MGIYRRGDETGLSSVPALWLGSSRLPGGANSPLATYGVKYLWREKKRIYKILKTSVPADDGSYLLRRVVLAFGKPCLTLTDPDRPGVLFPLPMW